VDRLQHVGAHVGYRVGREHSERFFFGSVRVDAEVRQIDVAVVVAVGGDVTELAGMLDPEDVSEGVDGLLGHIRERNRRGVVVVVVLCSLDVVVIDGRKPTKIPERLVLGRGQLLVPG
jgi:hypothetical protein